MRKYPIYKNSNTDYLGQIPNDWELEKIKFQGKVVSGSTPETGNREYWDGDIIWATPVDFGEVTQKYITTSQRKITKAGLNNIGGKLVPKGSVVISSRAPIGLVAIAGLDLATNQGCKSVIPKKVVGEYLYYSLKEFSTVLENYGNETVFAELSMNTLKNFFLPIPSKVEQIHIVKYLDYKTDLIDRFITNRQKQIDLLREQKQFILNKRLTEGIYPEKGFQDIVHPYINKVPFGWEFKKLAFLSKITRLAGYEYTTLWETEDDGEIIALRGQNVGFNELLDIDEADRISDKLSKRLKRSRLYKGDIVFPCVGTVGKAVLILEDNKYHINQNIAKITPKNNIDGLFLTLLLNSFYAYHQIIHFNTSDAQPSVLVRNLRRFMIPTPPYEEQIEISKQIIKEFSELDDLISKYQKQIDLMQEYRTAIISQAVTGKIDVRDWKPKTSA